MRPRMAPARAPPPSAARAPRQAAPARAAAMRVRLLRAGASLALAALATRLLFVQNVLVGSNPENAQEVRPRPARAPGPRVTMLERRRGGGDPSVVFA
jgi:hypothetical protein